MPFHNHRVGAGPCPACAQERDQTPLTNNTVDSDNTSRTKHWSEMSREERKATMEFILGERLAAAVEGALGEDWDLYGYTKLEPGWYEARGSKNAEEKADSPPPSHEPEST